MIHAVNPILPGFHPDPSICRVGEWFYLANSTFQWFPGVELHRSRDLVHWERLPSPLRRVSQLDLRGDPDSGGVWAPCLTYADGLFWLVYTDAKETRGPYKDVHNYVVTAEDPAGDWSEPVYLNSSGFDPSLFHDDDGRKYVCNMLWDHRPGHRLFAGIVVQEYSVAEKRLVGPAKLVYTGTPALGTEGPHLYKRDGTYYLMVAEGGTAYWHGIQLARSKSVWGPYESDPQPLLTAKHDHASPLQRTGHGCLVDTPKGDLFVAYLCGRPVPVGWQQPCPLCRETALVPVEWSSDGWLRMKGVEGVVPPVEFDVDLPEAPVAPEPERVVFDVPALPTAFKTLRVPFDDEMGSLAARPGWLRLYGRESPISWQRQSLVARRVQHFACEAETELEFAPESFQQMAGLMLMYDASNFFFLHLTRDEESAQNVLRLSVRSNREFSEPVPGGFVPLGGATRVLLRVRKDVFRLRFSYSLDGAAWTDVCGDLDGSHLCDEAYREMKTDGHTGPFVGMSCVDLTCRRIPADFRSFAYRATR